MTFKGVLMDIDNTLYDYDAVHPVALAQVFDFLTEKTGLSEEILKNGYKEARFQVHQEHAKTASSHNRALYLHRMCDMLKVNSGALVYEADQLYWDTFIQNMVMFPGVKAFLDSVKNLKLVFVTDLLAHIQFRKIRHLGLDEYNPAIVTSEEVGIEKPDPKIFQAALHKISLEPSEVCMIGDSLKRDILGAQNLGIKAFWIKGEKDQVPEGNGVVCFDDFASLEPYFK